MRADQQPLARISRRGRPPQCEGPALDRARLVATLLDMARSGGIDALNIRPVAQRLGVSPRLLYHHVRDKEAMLALLTDEILRGRMPDLSAPDWESRLRSIARAVHMAYRDFPGSAAFILSRSANRLELPNALAIRRAIFTALEEAGLSRRQSEEVLVIFSVIVLGNVVVAESLDDNDDRLAMQRNVVEAALTRATDMLLTAIRAIAEAA
ncbi:MULTISPECIES: TetR family transcriptional regulator [Sphingobium]|uniref:TetR family transcriptional regulator n=3 Tax=Sphingobium TaxID=165695 RepID=A0A5B8CG86_SPHSA|nr:MULTISPECIES: TetR family transcriptional regulator [Sphingobium]OAP33674.1 TetR family transcriptional regulator [Sphingobium sp. 20006FA]AJR25441.1 TetR family transcriptional regulator [Sphingobium sp. YBL2]KXU33609.1 TetR family transcriptional regulator [Sphingobium sp. AM]KYC34065.1 TetR family transcriptional regulator [Sphingobium sp. 22B]MDH2133358.1 TetR family transcriptional regulator [Sphingobium yanoikuyae]